MSSNTSHTDYSVSSAIPKRIIEHRESEAFTYPLYGSRFASVFPTTRKINEHFKSAAADIQIDGNDIAVLKDPYPRSIKMRLEDAYVSDPIVRRCITVNINFLLGRRLSTTIDTKKESMNLDKTKQVLGDTLNSAEVDKLKTLIDNINNKLNFHAKVEAATTQAYVGGRAALYVEKAGGMPVDLRVLNWSKLGQVYADKETWQFLGVEYSDKPKDEPLLANEIIYFAHNDFNISPDSLFHGRSEIETILDEVETNRFIHEEDLKEISRTLWAGSGYFQFPPNTTAPKIKEFLRGYMPGTWNATSQQVTPVNTEINPKIKELSDVSLLLDKRIRTALGTPGILVGDENILNYATAGMLMHAWRESDLNRARTWLQDTLEPQWFQTLLKLAFPSLDIQKMFVKAKLAYDDITFETLRDRAESLLPAVQSGYVSPEKFLEVLDMPDEIEKRAAMQEEQQKKRAQDLELMRQERQQQQQQTQPPQSQQEQQQQQKQQNNNSEEDQQQSRKRAILEATQAVKDEVISEVRRILDTQKSQQEQSQTHQEPQVPINQLVEALERLPQREVQPPREIIQVTPEAPTQSKQNEETDSNLRIMQASLDIKEKQQRYMEELHQKQLELMEEKREAYRQLKAKIEDLSS